jgi:hypothetical protein
MAKHFKKLFVYEQPMYLTGNVIVVLELLKVYGTLSVVTLLKSSLRQT